jgi:hypothetical protein
MAIPVLGFIPFFIGVQLLEGNIFRLLDLFISNGIGFLYYLDILHLFYLRLHEKFILLIVHFIYYN